MDEQHAIGPANVSEFQFPPPSTGIVGTWSDVGGIPQRPHFDSADDDDDRVE